MDRSKLIFFFYGTLAFVLGAVSIAQGKASFVVGTWSVAENPIRFWSYVTIDLIFGFLMFL